MKPRTKLQKQIVELSSKLPALTNNHKSWAIKNAIDHIGLRLKKGTITCTHCGKVFADTMKFEDGEIDICPKCYTELKVETSTRKSDRKSEYFSIITTCKGFQVFRFYLIKKEFKSGSTANYCFTEVVQRWLLPDGRFETMAVLANQHSYYIDAWCCSSLMEVRANDKQAYHIGTDSCYPVRKYLPEWHKYGFKGKIHGSFSFDFFHLICTNSKAETLLKAGQIELLRAFCGKKEYDVTKYWSSIKICMRNGYKVKDASIWIDYLDLLSYFRKDLHNAHYVCPKKLKAAHDFYMEKKRKEDEKAERERDLEKLLKQKKHEEEFIKLKSKFFDLNLSDGKIVIVVLKSLEDFKQEGESMKHCVFTNEYIKKKDSLILSARIGDKRIETIELNLKTLDVVQSRGACNQNTEYHDRIIGLVKNNINLIRQKLAS